MSYYYNYYIGYERNGKLYPLGPYNSFGDLKCAVWVSRSFASDLHDDFYQVPEDKISDELRKEFEYENWNGEKVLQMKYFPMDEMPKGSFIKTGYFLIDDVKKYEKDHDAWDLFYEHLSPAMYAAMLQNELTLGKPQPKKDCEGYEIEVYSASDYMYYAYPDYCSREYESFVIKEVGEMLYSYSHFENGEKLVVLETEG